LEKFNRRFSGLKNKKPLPGLLMQSRIKAELEEAITAFNSQTAINQDLPEQWKSV